MRDPLPGSHGLLAAVNGAVGGPTGALPIVIGVDGRRGSGKSSAAQWLGWQIRAPVIALDL